MSARLAMDQRMGLAHGVVLDQQLQIFYRIELGGLEYHWLGFGVWEESLRRWKMVSAIVGRWRGGVEETVPVWRIWVLP